MNSRQPYVEEARRRLEEHRRETPNKHGFLDEEIIDLMADYAAESWQEGWETGREEGFEEGQRNAETNFYDNG